MPTNKSDSYGNWFMFIMILLVGVITLFAILNYSELIRVRKSLEETKFSQNGSISDDKEVVVGSSSDRSTDATIDLEIEIDEIKIRIDLLREQKDFFHDEFVKLNRLNQELLNKINVARVNLGQEPYLDVSDIDFSQFYTPSINEPVTDFDSIGSLKDVPRGIVRDRKSDSKLLDSLQQIKRRELIIEENLKIKNERITSKIYARRVTNCYLTLYLNQLNSMLGINTNDIGECSVVGIDYNFFQSNITDPTYSMKPSEYKDGFFP